LQTFKNSANPHFIRFKCFTMPSKAAFKSFSTFCYAYLIKKSKVFLPSNNVIRICCINLEKSYQSSQIPEHNFLLLQMTNNRTRHTCTVHCSNYHILLTYCTTTSVSEIQASHKPRIWTLRRAKFLQNLWLRCPEMMNNAMYQQWLI